MKLRVPDYFDEFSCLAGACPHSCCMKWEVVLDPDTVQLYQSAKGPLGDRLRAAMQPDGEDVCFPLNGDRCPFLNEDGLCEVHLTMGEAATSVTCQEHPRFTEHYGSFREIILSASCPAANALLLGSSAVLTFPAREDDIPAEEGDPWLTWVVPLRDRLLGVLTDRAHPLRQRFRAFLQLADAAQRCIDEEQLEALSALPDPWSLPRPDAAPETDLPAEALRLLSSLEMLEPDWQTLLQQGETAAPAAVPEALLERIAVYLAFRYLLKAVNDGDLLGRAEFCVFSTLAVERLAAVCGLSEALRRYSCEIEHDEDNLDALLDAFQLDPRFDLDAFFTALSN